jgi:hypothetical protein
MNETHVPMNDSARSKILREKVTNMVTKEQGGMLSIDQIQSLIREVHAKADSTLCSIIPQKITACNIAVTGARLEKDHNNSEDLMHAQSFLTSITRGAKQQ